MGNTFPWALGLGIDAKVLRGELAEQEVVEGDGPNAVGRLLGCSETADSTDLPPKMRNCCVPTGPRRSSRAVC